MTNRYTDEWTASLLSPERRLGGLSPQELMKEAGLRPGMTVVDYGCGPGLLTLLAAKAVGSDGTVYALDIHQGMVALIESRAAEAGLGNVTALLNDGPEAPLSGGVADVILCTLVFHYKESRDERQVLADDLARLLRPGGCAMLVQWDDRAPCEEMHELLTAAGLTCGPPSPVVKRQYRVKATKPCDQ
ncbi:MAG: class I SAM-dependent methyltransferase [Chloroflexota bacterium]|nr:class I SAM-dependent methyltransferase [Chloroflexota bacterium]